MAKRKKSDDAETEAAAPEPRPTAGPGNALAAAVAEFEKQFNIVDDHYMHTGQARTDEGIPFVVVCAGGQRDPSGNIRYVPMTDHFAAIESWKKLAADVVPKGAKYLAWRTRPVFEAVEHGFILYSRLTAYSVISDETKARLKAGK